MSAYHQILFATDLSERSEEITMRFNYFGAHGHHGINALLGSRAGGILHLAPCDVLTLRLTNQ